MSINKMTIADILGKTVPFFAEKGIPNPRLEADLLLAHILDLPRVKLYSQWDRALEPSEIQRYREIIVKRIQGSPLAYLTGKKSFLSWDFIVNSAVLIPRPETELLVEAACDLLKSRPAIRGIDVGTGSGAIVIALAKLLPESTWYATDISNDALTVAAENARLLGVDSRITFLAGDLLEPVLAESSAASELDLVISNPPYIPSGEINKLQIEVRQEPLLALDGGVDGLAVYRRLLPQAKKLIAADGFLIFEHGADQKPYLEALVNDEGFTSQSMQDLAGRDRVLICRPGRTANA